MVEVLSPSSAVCDRREKAAAYVRLPSLRAYIVVDPEQPRIELYQREDGPGPGGVRPRHDLAIDELPLDVDRLYDWVAELT